MKKNLCLILGAGAPHQGNDPSLLEQVDGICVFDWLLNALSPSGYQVDLVLGYHSEEIAARYASVNIIENSSWETTGSAFSLLQGNLEGVDNLLVCYGDILFRQNLVEQLNRTDAPVVVAWDSHWLQRYVDRDSSDIAAGEKIVIHNEEIQRLGHDFPAEWSQGEFIGVVRFSGEALRSLCQLQKDIPEFLKKQHLSGLVEWLRINGLPIVGYDVAGDWAEMNHPKDIAHFVLGTKAETLSRLRSMISSAVIQDQISFTADQWQLSKDGIIQKALEEFSAFPVVVRSSAKSEDAFTHSNAGAYTSVLNVDVNTGLTSAIETVIASYGETQPDDQVLIQPMVQQVVMSGVAFTRTLEYGAPWYVINYEESGSTDAITAGHSNDHHVLYVRRDAGVEQVADPRLIPLVNALSEVERLLAYDALDVEFAIDRDGHVHILQVRPIAVEQANGRQLTDQVNEFMDKAELRWLSLQQPAPHILGEKPIYGIMPDWNPAEIIGTNPSRLAETLYRYLILDEVWATQRAEYGYRDVRPQPLLVSLAGKPYIDVRASFNSFIPADMPDQLAKRFVSFYLDWLRHNPHLHDKVEFDVVPTCLGLDFERWRQRFTQNSAFTNSEVECLKNGLRQITSNAIDRTQADLTSLNRLEKRYNSLVTSPSGQVTPILEHIQLLLDDCRLLGTLPFAHLARSGFVAVTLLKEAVATGMLSDIAQEQFMSTLHTVSHELNDDARATADGSISWSDFVEKYGHLRPGTYDLMSPSYKDDPEKYLRPLLSSCQDTKSPTDSVLWQSEKTIFFDALRTNGLNYTNEQFELFLRYAIEGREKAKFIFTRNLSAALDLIAQWGEMNDISRTELVNISLLELLELRGQVSLDREQLAGVRAAIVRAAHQREVSLSCELPALICKQDDFYSFLLMKGQPNFIGLSRKIASCINLAGVDPKEQPEVADCIVMIPQADPGYDWLFGQGIAGLVTMYGGANSHMAIRSAEFGLPAAIGIGERLYNQLSRSRVIELDPANSRLNMVN